MLRDGECLEFGVGVDNCGFDGDGLDGDGYVVMERGLISVAMYIS